MTITIKQTAHTVLPAGEYLASVGGFEEVDGQFGPQLKVRFDLAGEHEGKNLSGWAGRSFNTKSKLYIWTAAILGGTVPADWDFDSDQLVGRRVMLTVVKRVGTDGAEFNKLDSLAPVKVTPRPKRPAPKIIDDWDAETDSPDN